MIFRPFYAVRIVLVRDRIGSLLVMLVFQLYGLNYSGFVLIERMRAVIIG
jgi:hypothetical protein